MEAFAFREDERLLLFFFSGAVATSFSAFGFGAGSVISCTGSGSGKLHSVVTSGSFFSAFSGSELW